jgi:hypothetical protein
MSAGDIDAVRFGVFARGRPLEESEWKAIELLRAAGPSCLFRCRSVGVAGTVSRPRKNLSRARGEKRQGRFVWESFRSSSKNAESVGR